MRNNKNVLFAIINCAVVIFFIAVVGAIAILYNKPTYSELERRDLMKMPKLSTESYFDGSFTRDVSAYVADVFPLRDDLLSLVSNVKELYGFRVDDIKIHNVQVQETINPEAELPKEEMTDDKKIYENYNVEEVEIPVPMPLEEKAKATNGIYVYKGRAFELFGSSDSMSDYYASTVNFYDDTFGDDVKIYNLIVPSAIEFGLPEKYKKMSQPQEPRIEYVYSKLNPTVTPVRVYDTLNEHKDEYIYFSTDHHWTSLGAYYAYVEFAKAAGFEPVDINTLPKKTLNNFVGTLYGQTNDKSLLENPDHVDYYEMNYPVTCYRIDRGHPYEPQREPLYGEYALPVNSYSVYLHGDFPLTTIVTENKNGRKIAVIKESYGNAFVPFLINNYEEIYVVDERYFETDLRSLVEQNDIDEILIINNIAAAHTGFHIKNILDLVDQVYIPPAPPQIEEESVSGENTESEEEEEDEED